MWAAATVVVVVVAVWLGSGCVSWWWNSSSARTFKIESGQFVIAGQPPEGSGAFYLNTNGSKAGTWGFNFPDRGFNWWFRSSSSRGFSELAIPIWVFAIAPLIVFVIFVRSRGRSVVIFVLGCVKWGLAVLAAALVAFWFISLWWSVKWVPSDVVGQMGLWCGRLWIHVTNGIPGEEFFLPGEMTFYRYTAPRMYWWFEYGSTGTLRWLYVPLWVPFVLAAAGAFGAWKVRIGPGGKGRCGECGYELAGLANDAKCPECGGGPLK